MKKTIIGLAGLVLLFGFGGIASAAVSDVTPSTNDINRTNGWAHVDQLSRGAGETELEFVSTRGFVSCFEFRTDGNTYQKWGETNLNPGVSDGLYPHKCISDETAKILFKANEYVEVRMVFGAEEDERFDWTRFDVFLKPGAIVSPTAGEEVTKGDTLSLRAHDVRAKDGGVQWAVRAGTCAARTNTVAGNVDGFNNFYDWTRGVFTSPMSTSNLSVGTYCFVFNPTEGERQTQLFEIVEPEGPTTKMQCMKNSWENFGFKNRGQCIRFVETGKDSR